ncbi:FIST N-terminal domain-containing protein [Sulfurihydrogenibium sp.]|uniref:FIST N-terminal domain-containing protein n=1 Tax=Sulfurihydrogenibium sp. TaxID=2053621 RepID=UPI0026367B3D|nr:FIST N-terminal domain-containing protein [Sulfurihydrogenibium sp.]
MKTEIFYSTKESLNFGLKEIKQQLDNSFKEFDFLIFSFHPKYDYNDVIYFVNRIFKTDRWVGFHAIDAFANDVVVEGVVLLAIKFENSGKIHTFEIEDIEEKDSLQKTADYLNQNKDKLNIIIAGLCEHKFGFFVENLSKLLNYTPTKNIVGGLSSGYKKDGEILTYIFTPDKVIKNGFVVLSFDSVEFEIGISLGFKPYGITYEVKNAQGYKVFTVDDNKNFSYIIQSILKGIENPSIEYLWYCPIVILDDTEGYVATVRTPKELGKDYVEFFGPVKTGQKFKFSFGEKDELLFEDRESTLKVKSSIKHPDILFNFSCIARQYVLEEEGIKENQIYINTLNANLFGFFTFGEIGPDKFYKSLKFYNETSLLLAMREL